MRRGLFLVIAGAFADKPCKNAGEVCRIGEPDGSGDPLDRCGNGRGFMNLFTAFLLLASVGCSTARAVFSKKLGACAATSGFFRTQALLYIFAAVTAGVLNMKTLCVPSAETLLLGTVYGVLTLLAQGLYTVALKTIPVSVCAMVYSFGFVIPAVFGTLAFKEPVSPAKICSVLLCAVAVVLSAPSRGKHVYIFAAAVGAAMGGANTANTLLAGILPSIVVFPVTNVGVILASLAMSVLFLGERLTKRQAVAACFGIAAVALFSLPL